MNWDQAIQDFKYYLKLEKSLSENSIQAYLNDVQHLKNFITEYFPTLSLLDVKLEHMEQFLAYLNALEIHARSQARIISGIKAFYFFLELNDLIKENPTVLISTPKLDKKTADSVIG